MTCHGKECATTALRITGAGLAFGLALAASVPAAAQNADRLTFWDLELGSTLEEMPDWIEFRRYACGSNGGPPLRPLGGWEDFADCRPDATGLYEVYFEYDNEAEFILRAMDDPRAVRFVGTTESGFPVTTSALFDADGVLRGLRMVTDPRADYADDAFFVLSDLRPREDHFLMGPFVGAHFAIDAGTDCVPLPLAEGESEVGGYFTKLNCERIDEEKGVRYILQTRHFRKPGQIARDPVTGQLTQGQFESTTRAEIYEIGFGPA